METPLPTSFYSVVIRVTSSNYSRHLFPSTMFVWLSPNAPDWREGSRYYLRFLNLPLWANFYIYTDLSGTTTTTFRPTNPFV